ncbi:MAG: hypothetical protein AB7V46_11430 [Thermomicrobiales bacterium]
MPTYPTQAGSLLKAALGAFAVAIGVGLAWGYLPGWGFYLALLLGFGVAESMAYLTGAKRGLDLQIVGWLAVTGGLLLSRIVLAQRLDLSWDAINQLGAAVEAPMHLEIIPDGLFALIPFLIVYIRFR